MSFCLGSSHKVQFYKLELGKIRLGDRQLWKLIINLKVMGVSWSYIWLTKWNPERVNKILLIRFIALLLQKCHDSCYYVYETAAMVIGDFLLLFWLQYIVSGQLHNVLFHSSTYSLTHSHIHSFIHSLHHSLTHSLTYLLTYTHPLRPQMVIRLQLTVYLQLSLTCKNNSGNSDLSVVYP